MISPIPTSYAGRSFRSRAEARWAVFFDALELRYEYEPDAYELPSGKYLCDFRLHLPNEAVWFEVKPESDQRTIDVRWEQLAGSSERRLFVARGMPTLADKQTRVVHGNEQLEVYFGPAKADWGYHFCICRCGKVGIEFEGRSARVCERCMDGDKDRNPDHPRILAAYAAALGARFDPATATV